MHYIRVVLQLKINLIYVFCREMIFMNSLIQKLITHWLLMISRMRYDVQKWRFSLKFYNQYDF